MPSPQLSEPLCDTLSQSTIPSFAKPEFRFWKDKIISRAQKLSQFCKAMNIEVFFAVKASSDKRLLEIISPFVDGFDCSNLNEFKAVSSFLDGKKLSFYNPVADRDFFQTLQHFDCDITLEDSFEVSAKGTVFQRINPTTLFPQKTQSRFGVSIDELPKRNFKGIHFHVREIYEYLEDDFLEIIEKILKSYPSVEKINLGGGWHKIEEANGHYKILESICRHYPEISFRIEPGRFFTYNTGRAHGTVVRIDRQKRQITTNVSPMLHLNWAEVRIEQEIAIEEKLINVEILGPTCFEHDISAPISVPQSWFEKLEVGDSIVLSGLSSYTIQRQSAFNGIEELTSKID